MNAMAAARPCRHPGCGALVRDGSGYCETHKSKAKKATNFSRQLSSHARGYGAAWRKLRIVVMNRDAGLCQPCKAGGRLTTGNIVDHIKPKTEGGTDDMGNLQTICKRCHDLKTAGESARGGTRVQYQPEWLPAPVVPVTVVCGPPGSGKSTYVGERRGPGDLVLDVDVIAAEMFKLPLYRAGFEQRAAAVRYRNTMLASLADSACGYARAWLIVTANTPDKRNFWRGKYGDLIVMDTPKRTCADRIRNDSRRPEAMKKSAIEAVWQWC